MVGLKRILIILMLLLLVPIARCSVTSVEISPSNPTPGDTMSISIVAGSGEDVSVSLTYTGRATVSRGKYEIKLNDLDIPQTPNHFSARVSDVENIRVSTYYAGVIPVTINKDATNGQVQLSQGNIPASNYDITVWGYALPGVSEVDISFEASITLTMDGDGVYEYSYRTGSIPPGTIEVNVEGEKQKIELSPRTSSGGSTGGGAVPPVADFTISGERISGEVLSFDASSSKPSMGIISEYKWSFGDGATGSGETVSHSYEEPGEYPVKLTVKNSYNLEDSKTLTIILEEIPNEVPEVSGGESRACLTRQRLFFRSHSSDSDGVITQYLWSFGDGWIDTGKVVSHSWGEPGVYTVNHTVVDDRGGSASAFYVILVEEPSSELLNEVEVLVESTHFQYFGDLGASVKASGNNTLLYLIEYDSNPSNTSLPKGQIGSILDLVVSDPDSILWPIYFEMDYDRSLVDNVTETSLGLYYYSEGVWSRCLRTGVDLFRGVVWANLTRGELSGSPLTVGLVEPLPYFTYNNFRVIEAEVEEGEMITVQYNATNGGERSGNLVSLIYLGEEPLASKTIHLSPEETKTITTSFTAPGRGTYLVRLGDYVKPVEVTPPTIPDLGSFLRSNVTQLRLGDKALLQFTVHNSGNRTAKDFMCSLSVGGLRVSSNRIEALPPNMNLTYSYSWEAVDDGEYSAILTVDTLEEVVETNEGNNVSQITLYSEKPFPITVLLGSLLVLGVAGLYLWRSGFLQLHSI